MSLSRIRFLAVVIALLAGAAAQAAASQPGGVTFKFFTGSDGTKPDLISRQVAYAPGTATYGSIKAWSGMTANLGFDVSSTESNDLFGFSASSAGDVDGDGYDDIVVGAPLSNAGGSASGRVYVYSALSGQLLSQFSGYPGEQIGMSVAGIGDLDGDGKSDLAVVGRVQASSGNQEAVFIHSTANGDLLRAYTSTPGAASAIWCAASATSTPTARPRLPWSLRTAPPQAHRCTTWKSTSSALQQLAMIACGSSSRTVSSALSTSTWSA